MSKKRSCASATISFGLVSIPVKFYMSASAESVHFCYISPWGNRVEQTYRDKKTNEEVSRSEMNRGYEYAKDKVLVFKPEEIKALEETDSGSVAITEFVHSSEVDLLHVEKSYHLSPDKGGDRSYNLLTAALEKTQQYAVAQWTTRGKVHLVVIRPYRGGLVIHQMYYGNEIREFENDAAKTKISEAEVNMACQLVNMLKVDTYDPSKFVDTYQERVKKFVQDKIDGVTPEDAPKEPVKTNTNDLMAALMASLKVNEK